MVSFRQSAVIAIDGGGTYCRVALSIAARAPLVVETGPANVSSDFDKALREVSTGLDRLAHMANLSPDDLSEIPAFIGLAGVTGPAIAERLAASLPFKHVRIEDDRPASLRGSLGGEDGFVAHCGTGSFLAAQINGKPRLAGGWGPVLDDEASAQWVGRMALTLTLKALDGRVPPSRLTEELLQQYGSSAAIVKFAGETSPADLGRLAPLVTRRAETGDPTACRILMHAAADLSKSLRALGWHPGLGICLTGGIAPYYSTYLPSDMQTALRAPAGDPLSGAIALAWDLVWDLPKETSHEHF